MNVSIGSELEEFIKSKVATGDYASASEVVRDGLRLLKEKDHAREVELQAIRDKIEHGWQQAEAGLLLDGEEVMRKLLEEIEAKRVRRGD